MKVWVDGSAFESTRQRGVWRVFYEIMSRTRSDVEYVLGLENKPKQPIPSGIHVHYGTRRREITRWDLPRRLARKVSKRRDPVELRRCDLFHPTGFTLPNDPNIRVIVTVHDMIAESHFPICIRELAESVPIKRHSLEKADALPCDSEATRRELIQFYPHFADKAILVRLGADHLRSDIAPERGSHLENSRALFVGMRMGYKNFWCVIQAMADSRWPRDLGLDVVGPPFSEAESLLIRRYGLEPRISHLGEISDSQLQAAYQSAHCLIFPSFQEGFGLPCLEAQANGCPLVCSDIEVFREVAGDAAMFFDPRLGEQLSERVTSLKDRDVRTQLIRGGHENVSRFSWDHCAKQMLQVYQQALDA